MFVVFPYLRYVTAYVNSIASFLSYYRYGGENVRTFVIRPGQLTIIYMQYLPVRLMIKNVGLKISR